MARFYFPVLFWSTSSSDDVELAPFGLHPRRWDVSVFDVYSLAADRHLIRMPPELMHVFLRDANLEVSVDAPNIEEARKQIDVLRVMLNTLGIAPTIVPFSTSHSLNQYAGINFRNSKRLRDDLPVELRSGITSEDTRVEGWPMERNLLVLRGHGSDFSTVLGPDEFIKACHAVIKWNEIESQFRQAMLLRAALSKAELMPDYASSILHMWQALESVFGKSPELSLRMSLTLAELCGPVAPRKETYADAKSSYNDRSKITHGKAGTVDVDKWMLTWRLLVRTIQAILHRKAIPSEDELFSDLLSR